MRIVLCLAFLALWFAALEGRPLFNPDEGRYAEIPREMLTGGDWVVPRLNDLVYIEKPPLQYWATAVSYRVFGTHDWSARFYTGLTGLLTILAAMLFASRIADAAAGWRAGLVLGSSLLFVLLGHQITLDMSLTLWMTLILVGLGLAQHYRDEPSRSQRWMLLAWVAAALALLTKGLIAVLIPGAVFVVYTLWQRDWRAWRHLSMLWGLPAFLLVGVPWFVLIQHRLPQFFDFFFIHEHLERFLTKVHDRYEPWWFFIPVLAAGVVPWLLPVLRVFAGGWRRSVRTGEFDVRRLLWCWVLFIVVFFSLSDSKLIPYMLPVFPALAVLVALLPAPAWSRDLRITAAASLLIGALLAIAAIALPTLLPSARNGEYFLTLRWPLLAGGLLLVASGAYALRKRAAAETMATAIACAWFGLVTLLLLGARGVSPVYSGASLVPTLEALGGRDPNLPLYSVRTYDQTLPFYLERPVTLVVYRGELDFGLKLEPAKGIASLEAFSNAWIAAPQALAVMSESTYQLLLSQRLPMVRKVSDPRRVVVSRR